MLSSFDIPAYINYELIAIRCLYTSSSLLEKWKEEKRDIQCVDVLQIDLLPHFSSCWTIAINTVIRRGRRDESLIHDDSDVIQIVRFVFGVMFALWLVFRSVRLWNSMWIRLVLSNSMIDRNDKRVFLDIFNWFGLRWLNGTNIVCLRQIWDRVD